MTNQSQDEERERFEEWAKGYFYRCDDTTRGGPNDLYTWEPLNQPWDTWQASAREERKRIAERVFAAMSSEHYGHDTGDLYNQNL